MFMSEIIELGKSKGKRVKILLDDRPTFSLQTEVAAKEGLRVGQVLSASQIERLAESDRLQRVLDAAARYLNYRPQSETEIRNKLERRGFDEDITKAVIARLKEQGLLDDAAFAQFWKDNRQSFSPRSQRLTRLELKRKGVDEQTITQAVGELDDIDSAYRAALSRARRLPLTDYQTFRRRLGEHLRRRGFSYEVIDYSVQRIWKELGSNPR